MMEVMEEVEGGSCEISFDLAWGCDTLVLCELALVRSVTLLLLDSSYIGSEVRGCNGVMYFWE